MKKIKSLNGYTIYEATKKETNTEREQARKNILLNDLKRARDDSEEVHQLFISMLNEIEGQ